MLLWTKSDVFNFNHYKKLKTPVSCSHSDNYDNDAYNRDTVEPLLKDSPNKGHYINYLPTKDTL